MADSFVLLPVPRFLEKTGSSFTLPEHGLLVVDGAEPQALLPIAQALQGVLRQKAAVYWEIVAGKAAPAGQIRLALMVVPGSVSHPQGYTLTITSQRIDIVANTPAGIFYAAQTLRQLIEQCGKELPTLQCRDWPDFANRGVMLDISRDRVPRMETLYALIDLLASWKINQVQLYTEHTFAYRNHPEVWANASPVTSEEILVLDAYCRQRFIELVPNQNTFGHMQPWLTHERYRHLAECPDGCDTRWGHFDKPFGLNPSDPASLDLVRSLLDELLPHFSSMQVNIGCDETVDLGMGASQERVAELGVGRVYLEFLMKIYREVKARRRTVQFWGDIIMEHPELTPELPRDVLALEWGYEAEHPFDEHGAAFAASGIPFYVCPGTSSWNTLAGRTDNAVGNLRNAAINGLKHGAVGYLNTDWGDNGHWQPLPVSYLGFAYGAALAWDIQANLDLDIPRALDIHAFRDTQGVMGKLVYDLGNVYQIPGIRRHNASVLFGVLQFSPQFIRSNLLPAGERPAKIERCHATLQSIDDIMAALPQAAMQRSDAELVQSELTWAANMLRHACRRLLWILGETSVTPDRLAVQAQQLMVEYKEIWHARSRPGGFADSLARMEKMCSEYGVVEIR